VPSPVAARRLELHAAARSDPAGFLRLDRAGLRFSLGTSLADLAIPIEVAADARAIVRGAAAEIALLLATHHRRLAGADELDRLILREEYATLPRVAPVLGPAAGGADVRAAAALGFAAHPLLCGGIVGAWLGKGGRGRSLVALWIELLRRAFGEMAATRGREETPLVVALALAAETAAAEGVIRELLPAGPAERPFRAAALAALWVAARTGVARAWRDAGIGEDDRLLARVEAVLAPAPLLGGRAGVLGGGVTLYGCELAAGVPEADPLGARLASGADADMVIAELAHALGRDEELARRAETAVAVARLRALLAEGVAAAELAGAGDALASCRELVTTPGALAAAAADDDARRALVDALLAPKPEAGSPLERAARVLRAWKVKEPGAALGLRREVARSEYAVAAAALLCDLALERQAAPARRLLSFRTGREAEGGADAEWEGGRLYRLSARPGAILRAAVDLPVGHLFADVKDFTRRTGVLGQASMAELLRSEFYTPVLVAAKRHFGGMGHLQDRGGVAVNNLVGDAISFSGRIDGMVALARDVRRAFAAYDRRLQARISEAAACGTVASEAASRAALEAGVFISFGQAPVVVAFDDEVFGRNRVAIADKINESARGTARAPAARARADAALARERVARETPALPHAWSVFVGPPLAIPITAELEAQAVAAMRAGDLAAAMRLLAPPARDALELAAREPDRPGDVYNGGAALSEEALLAYLAEVEGTRTARRLELAPAELPEALRARWFFGEDPLPLIALLERGRVVELFRRVGRASFKGLGGVVIWELCAEDGGPAALAAALGPVLARGSGAR
jgi:hypothetical protein